MLRSMPRVAEAERPARRRRLIDAAWRCLARGSYADLRVEDVCAEAGLSKGSFYGYFESKRELFYTLVDEDSELLDQTAEADPASSVDAVENLVRVANASLRVSLDPARAQLHADIWAAATQDEELRARVRDAIARRRVILRGRIERAVDDGTVVDVPPHALAALVLALVDGLSLHYRIDPSGFRSENVQRAVELMLTSLRDRPHRPIAAASRNGRA
jgi:AcrR family transcriptional regulator